MHTSVNCVIVCQVVPVSLYFQYNLNIFFLPIRYPDDVYDRYWKPYQEKEWVPVATNSTIYSQSNDDNYNIPNVVLSTAAKTENASIPLNLNWSSPDSLLKCYVYFHFSEIEKLEAGQQRELTINLNGERYLAESIKLEYLNVRIIPPNDPPISGQKLHFSIHAAEGSKFPPILNAVEMFLLKELPNKTTAVDEGILSSLFYFPSRICLVASNLNN